MRLVALVTRTAQLLPGEAPHIFIVHHPDDAALAERLAHALRVEHGVDAWLEKWEILGGDNIVAMIEGGLRRAHGGLILVGKRGLGGWSAEQYAALVARAQEEGSPVFLMPVLCDAAVEVPPFLKHRAPHPVEDVEAIARAIFGHVGLLTGDKPALGTLRTRPMPTDISLRLRREGDTVLVVCETGAGRVFLPHAEAEELGRRLVPRGLTRDATGAGTVLGALDAVGARLGEALAGIAGWLAGQLRDPARGETVVRLCGDDLALLSLPWEAAHVPGFGPLGLINRVSVLREVTPERPAEPAAIPGPLRLLIVVAAPHDDLDTPRALGVILDAVQNARLGEARVVFVDEGEATLVGLRRQLDGEEPFHILHVLADGRPGALLLEDGEGRPDIVSLHDFADVLVSARYPPALVVLSTSSTGAAQEGLGHMHAAHVLLRAGVPQVIALQGPLGDGYATELTRHFYAELSRSAAPIPVHALAVARRAVEQQRKDRAERGEFFHAPVPEYATPAFYGAPGLGDRPLFDGRHPWAPAAEVGRLIQVPGLSARPIGWIVGRRRLRHELRQALLPAERHGALLYGLGGSGKSSLAASALDRLVREGWGVIAFVGAFGVGDVAEAAVKQLTQQGTAQRMSAAGRRHLAVLAQPAADERAQLAALEGLLAGEQVVLLLDNFEDNLERGPDGLPRALHDGEQAGCPRIVDGLRRVVRGLVAAARRGAVVVTCRYRVADLDDLTPLEVGPLGPTAIRQLVWRLPGLRDLGETERAQVLAVLGGHPRVLEFADALLRTQPGRWRTAFEDVRGRIERLSQSTGDLLPSLIDLPPEERLVLARRLAAEDVLLGALVATLDDETRRFLVAVAVFRRGVPLEALAVVAAAAGLVLDRQRLGKIVERLVRCTLLSRTEDLHGTVGWMVHRWTAAELHRQHAPTRMAHVAAARWWEDRRDRSWEDGLEAVEHWFAAGAEVDATMLSEEMREEAKQTGRNLAALALCEHTLAGVTAGSDLHATWLGFCADHLHILGDTQRALVRAKEARAIAQHLVGREPGRSAREHLLSTCEDKLGKLYRALGNVEAARRCFEDSLTISRRRAEIWPGCADVQRDLAVANHRLGDLHRDLGNGDLARKCFEDALAISQRLSENEPDCLDYQRDLFVACNKLCDLHVALGSSHLARRYLEEFLARAKRLADAEPARSDLQRDLVVAYDRLGRLHLAHGEFDIAREVFERALDVTKRLLAAEPGHVQVQRDLGGLRVRLGDLCNRRGDVDRARLHLEDAIDIRVRLVDAEPDRADLQHDLAASHDNLGDLHRSVGSTDLARQHFEAALSIARRLTTAEPGRADLKRDLSVSCNKLGDLYFEQGNMELARRFFEEDLAISLRLAEAEPGRADLQRDLAISLERMAAVEPESAVQRLSAAVAIRRERVAAEPASAIVRRELAVTLLQLGCAQATNGRPEYVDDARREAHEILRELEERGALEARYRRLLAES